MLLHSRHFEEDVIFCFERFCLFIKVPLVIKHGLLGKRWENPPLSSAISPGTLRQGTDPAKPGVNVQGLAVQPFE